MIESPVTYNTFWVIFLQQEPTVPSIYRLIRDFFLYKGVGSRTASTFIVTTTVFALAFPTFMNSMTGYVTKNSPFVQVPDGNFVPLSEFKGVVYVIRDGRRINMTDDYNVDDGTTVMPDGTMGMLFPSPPLLFLQRWGV